MKNSYFDARELVLVALFAALIVALGFVYIPLPFTPVPIHAQSLGVMLAGCVLGRRLGSLSVLVFVLLAAVGVPVLAGGRGGLGVVFGPTGGYLLGYLLAPFVIGLIAKGAHRGRRALPRLFIAAVVGGLIVVYIPGVLWLAYITHLTLLDALIGGAAPFIIGDLFKALAAALVAEGVYAAYPMERILTRRASSNLEAS